jgi:hypothetical protein
MKITITETMVGFFDSWAEECWDSEPDSEERLDEEQAILDEYAGYVTKFARRDYPGVEVEFVWRNELMSRRLVEADDVECEDPRHDCGQGLHDFELELIDNCDYWAEMAYNCL